MTSTTAFDPASSHARELDEADPLARFRARFHLPKDRHGNDAIYFGTSCLGLLPRSTAGYIARVLSAWSDKGIEAWWEPAGDTPPGPTAPACWIEYHDSLVAKMARLVGALPHEVTLMNSLTTNLHSMLFSFYRPAGDRHAVLTEEALFPTVTYALSSHLEARGLDPAASHVRVAPGPGRELLTTETILDRIEGFAGRVALVLFCGVNYLTGQRYDMRAIAAKCREVGCTVGLDLAHAVGNVALDLHAWDVDFAVWCSYKYLNAGPGGIGGCFVHERHLKEERLPILRGWWGNNPQTRFRLRQEFDPCASADRFQHGTAPVLSLATLHASLDVFDEAGLDAVLAKSERLTGYLASLLGGIKGVSIVTPLEPGQRGSMLCIRVVGRDPTALIASIKQRGVVCDLRPPDIIRFAPAPLYNTFSEAYRLSSIVKELVE